MIEDEFLLDEDETVYPNDIVRFKHIDMQMSDGFQLAGKTGVVRGLFFDGKSMIATVKLDFHNRLIRIESDNLEVLERSNSK